MQATVRSASVSNFESTELRQVTALVRSTQRCLDGLIARIGMASDQLATEGRSGPASEVLLDGGSVSGSTAGREASRAKISAQVPGLAEAMVDGTISAEHVDSISRHTNKLTDAERTGVDFEHLIDKAGRLPAGTFDTHMKRHVEDIKSDHGLSDTVSKQKASEFRHWFDQRSGTIYLFAGSPGRC